MRRRLSALITVLLFGCSVSSFAQFGGLMKRGEKKQAEVSTSAPEYSDADKQKLAEIAQRPAVQDAIQAEWDEQRRQDLETAFSLNQTANWSISADPTQEHRVAAEKGRLYSNPMLQIYLNNIGQRLVPKDSPNLFTFRILADPMPRADALSTGTIYISTGLISMLDSEAQLSYVLAHEIAHIERNHAYNRVRDRILDEELYKEKEAKAQRNAALVGMAGSLTGGLLGGIMKGGTGAMVGALTTGLGAYVAGDIIFRNKMKLTEWKTVEEDEADEIGVKYMLSQGYDAREIPRLYASLDRMIGKDSRLGLGFMGNPRRVRERIAHVQQLLSGPMKDDLAKLVQTAGAVGSNAEFAILLSAANRDNGILAMDYDLFAMARQNLEDAAAQRSNDPTVHYYLSRVIALTARTPEDKRLAITHVSESMRLDANRGAIPDLHLEYALSLLHQDSAANREQIVRELKAFVALYQRDHGGALPGNMYAIFDYFNLVGETSWYLPPGWYPATQLMSTSSANPIIAPEPVLTQASAIGQATAASGPDSASPRIRNVVKH